MSRNISANVKTEAAKSQNAPIYLVEIKNNISYAVIKRFTNYNSDVTFAGNVYTSWGFKFNPVKSSINTEVDRVEIQFDNTDLVMRGYNDIYDFCDKIFVIKRVFSNLLSDSDDAIIVFSGKAERPSFNRKVMLVKINSPIYEMRKNIPKRIYSNFCQWTFDSDKCLGGESSLADETIGTADAGSTSTEMIDSARTEADDYWNDGVLEMTSGDNNGEKRQIIDFDNVTNKTTLIYAFSNAISSGDDYIIKRGCDKTALKCRNTFDNFVNFGGFQMIPKEKS